MIAGGWFNYFAAFTVFFLSHMVLVRPPVRPWLVHHLTQRGFTLAYSALSVAILWWLIKAAKTAPYVALWTYAPWQNWVPILLMLPVCLILSFGLGRPNPLSFGGWQNDRFDPHKPGLVKWMRHPILAALFLWSASHLVPNGDLAHVLLFGSFALFSILGMKLIDRRRQRELGDRWQGIVATIRSAPGPAPAQIPAFLARFIAGLGLYAVLAALHPWFAGVDPLTAL